MAITTFTLRYNANAFAPPPSGDLTTAVYDVVITAAANTYPSGGESVDFSTEFAEVHSVVGTPALEPPTVGAADNTGVMVPVFQRATGAAGDNQGTVRLYQADGGALGLANLAELTVGAYPNNLQFTLVVHGRPITDAQ